MRGFIVVLAESFRLEIFMMRFLIIGFGIAIVGAGSRLTCVADTSQGQSLAGPARFE